MILPITANITRKRGDTKPFRFTIKTDGSDQSVSGFSMRMLVGTVKNPTDESTKLFEMIGTTPGDGKIEFRPTTSNADYVGTTYYDAQIIDGAGDIYTISEGTIKFSQDKVKAVN